MIHYKSASHIPIRHDWTHPRHLRGSVIQQQEMIERGLLDPDRYFGKPNIEYLGGKTPQLDVVFTDPTYEHKSRAVKLATSITLALNEVKAQTPSSYAQRNNP